MNCPKCNSTYVEELYSKIDFEDTMVAYMCSNCSHKFFQKIKRELPAGELVLDIRGMSSWDGAQFYLQENGALTILQKMSDDITKKTVIVTLNYPPKFKINQFLSSYSICYDSYRRPNDKNGTLFRLAEMTFYGAWLEKAKKSEAIMIALRTESLSGLKNEAVVKDAIAWLNQLMFDHAAGVTSQAVAARGCYVATCVYGSYDCPEVWTLRRYRDDTLGATWYGRAFIRLYYAVSPTLVKWFGKTRWFKRFWKGTLDRKVQKLNRSGVKNTPYEDKPW